jgi:hypothetical protein
LRVKVFATGKEDFLLDRTKETVALLEKFGLESEFKETGGGHTWINWQEYFNEFAPKLFNKRTQATASKGLAEGRRGLAPPLLRSTFPVYTNCLYLSLI